MNELPAAESSGVTSQATHLRFTRRAWAKLCYAANSRSTEVGGFGVSDPKDPLLIVDFAVLKQTATAATFDFDDDAMSGHLVASMRAGLEIDHCLRVWIHTHPGSSASPSGVDETVFAKYFGDLNWGVMFIMGRETNWLSKPPEVTARMRLRLPGIFGDRHVETPLSVSFEAVGNVQEILNSGDPAVLRTLLDDLDFEGWKREMDEKVSGRYQHGYWLGHGRGADQGNWAGRGASKKERKAAKKAGKHEGFFIGGGGVDEFGNKHHYRRLPKEASLPSNCLGWCRLVEGGKNEAVGDSFESLYVPIHLYPWWQACMDATLGKQTVLAAHFGISIRTAQSAAVPKEDQIPRLPGDSPVWARMFRPDAIRVLWNNDSVGWSVYREVIDAKDNALAANDEADRMADLNADIPLTATEEDRELFIDYFEAHGLSRGRRVLVCMTCESHLKLARWETQQLRAIHDYDKGVDWLIEFIEEHRDEILTGILYEEMDKENASAAEMAAMEKTNGTAGSDDYGAHGILGYGCDD